MKVKKLRDEYPAKVTEFIAEVGEIPDYSNLRFLSILPDCFPI
jgi:hypothetical protein